MQDMNSNRGLITWFVNNPVAANLLMLIVLILGGYSASKLQIQGFPSIEANTISVDITYNSGSAKQTEEGVTIKVEEALQGVDGIREIRSTSSLGSASITIEKVSDYDLNTLNEEVTNRVNAIYGLPATSEKPVITKQKDEEHAIWFDVYGDVEQGLLQDTARKFKQALLRLPAVNKVIESGWKKPEISIEVDEAQLQRFNLTLASIANVVALESFNETSGELRSQDGVILLKADKQRYFDTEFGQVLVATDEQGNAIKLRDIAQVKDGYEESPNVLSRFRGLPAINYQVIVSSGSNVLDVAEQAKHLQQEWIEQGKLPAGVNIASLWDRSSFMTDRLGLLLKNGAMGALLVILTLTLFLNLRVALWVGLGLPVCFAGALILMGDSFFSLSLNELTTFGFIIVLGILVDDAVVVGESVYATKTKLGDSLDSTVIGVKRIAVPTLFGVLTTIAAFYPMSYISGDLGKIFSQFALVAVGCLIFSLIESKLILPSHLAGVRTQAKPTSNIWFHQLKELQTKVSNSIIVFNKRVYQPAVAVSLKYRYAVLAGFISFFILVIGLIPSGRVGFVFFPEIPRNVIEINYAVEQGHGYKVAHKQADIIEQKIEKINQDWLSQDNTQAPLFRNVQIQALDDLSGNAIVEVHLPADGSLNNREVEQLLRAELTPISGIRELQILTDTISISSFSIKLQADSRDSLDSANTAVIAFLQQTKGVSDIQTDLAKGAHQIEFELTPFGRSVGLTTAELSSQVSSAFYGAEVQRVQRGKDEVKVFVRYPANQRKDITDIENAWVRTKAGQTLPLSEVASMKHVATVRDIKHVNGRLSTTISAKVDKYLTSPDQVMEQVETKVISKFKGELRDVDYKVAGESAQEQETMSSMLSVFALSLFLIYILTAVPLKSYLQPIIIMIAIPFGILGAVLGHWFIGIPISILSLLGVLALSGVVVNNSLLIVSVYNELIDSGESVVDAVKQACSERLRAIFLTSVTTYAGLASLLQETSEQAAYLIPAAASLAYGILFSTTISLLLVPVLLVIFDDIGNLFTRLLSNLKHEPRLTPQKAEK